jgi:hypothetical protein
MLNFEQFALAMHLISRKVRDLAAGLHAPA